MTMPVRLPYRKVAPGVYRAMRVLQDHVNACGLEHSLLELVKLRASYINGCAFWNRFSIALGADVGAYQPASTRKHT